MTRANRYALAIRQNKGPTHYTIDASGMAAMMVASLVFKKSVHIA
jgi:hypothetical protein